MVANHVVPGLFNSDSFKPDLIYNLSSLYGTLAVQRSAVSKYELISYNTFNIPEKHLNETGERRVCFEKRLDELERNYPRHRQSADAFRN